MTRTPMRRAAPCSRAPRRAAPSSLALPGLALAALAGPLAGCSDDAGVLARVNREAITVAEFNEVARGNLPQYDGPPDSMKARLLKDLVDRELLVQGALREHLDETPGFEAFRRTLERQVLREALFQRLLGGPFPVSDAEVKELYDRRAVATSVRLIFTFDEATARAAAKDLARGEDFARVADRYNPPGAVPPGGDIGFIQPGTLLAPLDEMVRTGAPGQVVGPVASGTEGWFLVRIEERRPQPQPPLEEMRGQLDQMLRQRKQRAAATRAVDRLRVEYQVIVLPGAAQALVGKLRPTPGDGPDVRTPPPPGPEDRKLLLARYQGGAYTLGEAYDDLLGGGSRPNFAMLPTVERWIQSQSIERVALADAYKRHLNEEPDVKRRIRERLDNYLLDGYYQRQVIARIRIDPGDFRVAYERYRGSFVRLQSAHVTSVTMRDSSGAAALAAQAGHAPSLREAAVIAGAGDRVREQTLGFPSDTPVWAGLESRLMTMGPGDIAGPLPVEEGWLIFQLRKKQQDAPSFEGLAAEALGQLQGLATEMQREARLAALTDSLRHAFAPIVVYSDRLRHVPWPPAPAGPPGT